MNLYKEIISLLCRLIIAIIFLYASYNKIWNPANFATSVANYDIIPIWGVNTISIILAWLEFIIGIMLLFGIYTRAAVIWAAILILIFISLMTYNEINGSNYNCGCFPGNISTEETLINLKNIFRDILLLFPIIWLIWQPGKLISLKI